LKEKQKGRKGEEEDVSSYWMNLKNRGYWELKDEALYHSEYEEIALEEAKDLS
jgi:hypothetical protein